MENGIEEDGGQRFRNAKCGKNGEKMKKEGSAMQVLKRRG